MPEKYETVYPNILIVDDEKGIRDILRAFINISGYSCETVGSLREAQNKMERKLFDIIFLDLNLEDGYGMDFIEKVLNENSDAIIVIVSGIPESKILVESIQNGAFDYVEKPFNLNNFHEKFESIIIEWKYRYLIKQYQLKFKDILENYIKKKEINSKETRYKDFFNDFGVVIKPINNFIEKLNLPFPETRSHRERLASLCKLSGRKIGLKEESIMVLKYGAYLHDIGMSLESSTILENPGLLSDDGIKLLKRHPITGFSIVERFPFFGKVSRLILHHHEWYNGDGYPIGLSEDAIPIEARIFSIIDAFDSMIIGRPYKNKMSYSEAIKELRRFKNKQFDPLVVDTFVQIPEETINIIYIKKSTEEESYVTKDQLSND